jgi:hypothetical protein
MPEWPTRVTPAIEATRVPRLAPLVAVAGGATVTVAGVPAVDKEPKRRLSVTTIATGGSMVTSVGTLAVAATTADALQNGNVNAANLRYITILNLNNPAQFICAYYALNL